MNIIRFSYISSLFSNSFTFANWKISLQTLEKIQCLYTKNLDVYISYAHLDSKKIKSLKESLDNYGINLINPEIENILSDNYNNDLKSLISKSNCTLLYVSENSLDSPYVLIETSEIVQDLTKIFIPIFEDNKIAENKDLSFLNSFFSFSLNGDLSQDSFRKLAKEIYIYLNRIKRKELLIEKVDDLSQLDYSTKLIENLCELIKILVDEFKDIKSSKQFQEHLFSLVYYLKILKQFKEPGFSGKNLKMAFIRKDTIDYVKNFLDTEFLEIGHKKKFASRITFDMPNKLSSLIKDNELRVLQTLYRDIVPDDLIQQLDDSRLERRDAIFKVINSYLEEESWKSYQENMEKRNRFIQRRIKAEQNPSRFYVFDDEVTEEDIEKTNFEKIRETNNPKQQTIVKNEVNLEKKEIKDNLNKKINNYELIANYIKLCNQLFEALGNNSIALDFLRCLKTSYKRLKNYSEIVGYNELVADCVDRIAELNQAIEDTSLENAENNLTQNSFKALLGFSLEKIDNFDVFLSYKHEDIEIAKTIYHYLKSQLIYPFFDLVTLPELSDSDYEEAIMEALDNSKNFIVILSNLDYLNSDWIKLEMKTFHHERVEGRKHGSNFIFIVTNDVYDEIVKSNKKCLPIQFRSYEIIKTSEFKKVKNYLQSKKMK